MLDYVYASNYDKLKDYELLRGLSVIVKVSDAIYADARWNVFKDMLSYFGTGTVVCSENEVIFQNGITRFYIEALSNEANVSRFTTLWHKSCIENIKITPSIPYSNAITIKEAFDSEKPFVIRCLPSEIAFLHKSLINLDIGHGLILRNSVSKGMIHPLPEGMKATYNSTGDLVVLASNELPLSDIQGVFHFAGTKKETTCYKTEALLKHEWGQSAQLSLKTEQQITQEKVENQVLRVVYQTYDKRRGTRTQVKIFGPYAVDSDFIKMDSLADVTYLTEKLKTVDPLYSELISWQLLQN